MAEGIKQHQGRFPTYNDDRLKVTNGDREKRMKQIEIEMANLAKEQFDLQQERHQLSAEWQGLKKQIDEI